MKAEKFFRHAWMICLVLIAVLAFGGTNSMAAAEASKVSYTITNKSKKASYKNRLSANYLYQLPQLKGSSAAIKKITKIHFLEIVWFLSRMKIGSIVLFISGIQINFFIRRHAK